MARAVIGGRAVGGEALGGTNDGLAGSWSGGGVGGNMFRLTGGSDCCRVVVLLCNPGRTRFEAAKEILSRGRSSLLVSTGVVFFLASEPAKPVKVFP